jgi:hypothetical protein
MRDIYELLRKKEIAIERLAREVEALRLVAPLLTDDIDAVQVLPAASRRHETAKARKEGTKTGLGAPTEPLSNGSDDWQTGAMDDRQSQAPKKLSIRLKRLATPLLNATRFAG